MDDYKPTLIIGLNDVIIHREWFPDKGWMFVERPGVKTIFNELCKVYFYII